MIRLTTNTAAPSLKCAHYRIGDIRVSFRTALDDVLQNVAALYRGYPPSDADQSRTIRMEVRKTSRSYARRARYLILGDGEEIGKERRRAEILPFLEWGVNWRVITTRHDLLLLHAATMEYAGNGVVFAGVSGCGKSTLVAGLLPRGWNYLSDEFALIDPNTLCLRPFPKAVCIKSGAFGIVRRMNLPFAGRRYYVKGLKGRVGYINPYDLGSGTIARPTPIRFVIFPNYVEGREPRLYSLSRARAALSLARCGLNRNVFPNQAIPILSDVVRGAECFRLESGPLADTCELIESLVTNGHGRCAKIA